MTGWAGWGAMFWGWLSRRSIRQMVLGAGAIALLLSGVFGGLREAPPEARTELVAGTVHEVTPFEITIDRVVWSTDLGESFDSSTVHRFLVVFADVRSTQDESVDGFVLREALRIRGLDRFTESPTKRDLVASQDADPQVVVATDRVPLGEIGPGLTYEVAYIWRQFGAEPLPTTVELESFAHGFRRSSIDSNDNWFDRSPDAVGTFPVTRLETP